MSYSDERKLLYERQAAERKSMEWRHSNEVLDLAIKHEDDDEMAKAYMDGVREALAKRR